MADPRPKRSPQQRAKNYHLIVIVGVMTKCVTIAVAPNVARCLQERQVRSPDELVVLAWGRKLGAHADLLRQRLAPYALHGDWFSPDATAIVLDHLELHIDEALTDADPFFLQASAAFALWIAQLITERDATPSVLHA